MGTDSLRFFFLVLIVTAFTACGTAAKSSENPQQSVPCTTTGEKSSQVIPGFAPDDSSSVAPCPPAVPASLPPAPPPEPPVNRWIIELAAIPLTVQGREQNAAWRQNFDRRFGADERGRPEIARAHAAWTRQRQMIFEYTKNDFIARLNKLPAGPDGRAQQESLFTSTFPLPYDASLDAYKDYRGEVDAYQKSVVRKGAEATVDFLGKTGKVLSDAARKLIHGSEEKAPQ